MNVYVITGFEGHYPVGTSAAVVAVNRTRAAELLQNALAGHGLKGDIDPDKLRRIDTTEEGAIVLQNGDY